MVRKCYACQQPYEKRTTRSYHLFPKDMAQRMKWLQILGIEISYQRFISLCSDHFLPSDFYYEPIGRKRLRSTAVPINIASGSGIKGTSARKRLAKKEVDLQVQDEKDEFPKDDHRRRQWLQRLGYEADTILPKFTVNCSNNFEEDSFQVKTSGIKALKKTAMPVPHFPIPEMVQGHTSSGIRNLTPSPSKLTIKTEKEDDHRIDSPLTEFPIKTEKDEYLIDPLTSEFFIKTEQEDEYLIENSSPIMRTPELEEPIPSTSHDIEDVSGLEVIKSSSSSSSPSQSSSSSTMTASETEEQLLSLIKDPNQLNTLPENIVGPHSGFRGKLALAKVAKKRNSYYVGDLTSDDFSTSSEAEISLKDIMETVVNQRKTIKNLKEQVKRLKQRNDALNIEVKELRERSRAGESGSGIKVLVLQVNQ